MADTVASTSKQAYVPTHTQTQQQSNMCVSETGGSLLHRLHTALIVVLSAEEERELGSRVNKNSQTGKRGGWGGGKEGMMGWRAGKWWTLLIAIVTPPLP